MENIKVAQLLTDSIDAETQPSSLMTWLLTTNGCVLQLIPAELMLSISVTMIAMHVEDQLIAGIYLKDSHNLFKSQI